MICSKSTLCDALTVLLVVTFGTSTWVSLGGIWVELPLLTNLDIPEGYKIGSYFTIVTQAAVIGPLIFVSCQCFAPKKYHLEIPAIYAILAVGATASFLMIFFWDSCTFWFGEEHSTAFLILSFFMALVDSTSNLTFMPFISSLKSKYLNWYFIGEGLSSVIPSIVVLIQGSGGEDECVANYTFTNTTKDPVKNVTIHQNCTIWDVEKVGDFRFPPQYYFTFIFVLFALSTISYWILRCVPLFQDQYEEVELTEITNDAGIRRCLECRKGNQVDEKTPLLLSNAEENKTQGNGTGLPTESCEDDLNEESSVDREREIDCSMVGIVGSNTDRDITGNSNVSTSSSSARHAFLFITLTLISALFYGVLPAIQGYSAAAYGSHIYLVATAFAEIGGPVGTILVMIRPTTSYPLVFLMSLGGVAAGGYCILTASLSPTPPLQGHTIGEVLIVLAWILQGIFFSYCRAAIGGILRSDSRSWMLMMFFGGCTTIGTIVGAVIIFPLVSVLKIFKSFDPSQACASLVTCLPPYEELVTSSL
ncbi:solute carrier family 52, riboflavin transporter, member 3-like [Lytechinus variegatus]|uniref:solute carrier family 52, riboflavin transporter, member 3-like n=1 Tax=Lytechinus variegatus TaxID=7654 RepID=UPI001BB2CC87|nr:solute carrier family 52, riboflavin transporter, member 3-like [Lytechinus variegatus]